MAIQGDVHDFRPEDVEPGRLLIHMLIAVDLEGADPLPLLAQFEPYPEWKEFIEDGITMMDGGSLNDGLARVAECNLDGARFRAAMEAAEAGELPRDEANAPLGDESDSHGWTLADVAELVQDVQWLWLDWVPLGFVTLVAGSPGIGKSIFALHGLVAPVIHPDRFTFPDGSRCEIPEGSSRTAVWVDTEFAQAMVVERARNLKLDLTRIRIPRSPTNPKDPLAQIQLDDPTDLAALREQVRETKAPLVVVDAFLGAHGGNESKSRDVARLLTPLAELARDEGIAIVVIDHLRKSREGEDINLVSLERIRDSGAKAQYARSVIALDTPDHVHEGQVRIRVIKLNLCRPPEPLGMRIIDPGVAEWLDDAPERQERQFRLDYAASFLRELLVEARPVKRVREAADAAGIAWKTVERAKKWLGVVSTKRSDGWYWSLPGARDEPEGCEAEDAVGG